MIKLLHTGDIHANKTRAEDIVKLINIYIEEIKTKSIDAVLFCGDFWDCAVVNNTSFSKIVAAMSKLISLVPVYMIYGTPSHEISNSLEIFKELGANVTSEPKLWTFTKGDETINILGIPEPRRSDFIASSVEETNRLINEHLEKSFNIKSDYPTVVMFHGEVSGSHLQNGVASKSDTQLTKKMYSQCNPIYIATAHIHEPQTIDRIVHYCGSAIPCNFGELHNPQYSLVSIKDGKPSFETVELPFPQNRVVECDFDLFGKLKNLNLANKNVKVKLSLTPEQRKMFRVKDEASKLQNATNAHHVTITISTTKEVSIRSKEIIKTTSVAEKLKIYSDVNNIKLTPSIVSKAKEVEDNMFIKYTYPSHSFELCSLSLKGAKGLNGREEFNVDFTKYQNGILALQGSNGSGKCVTGDTLILGEDGFEEMELNMFYGLGYTPMERTLYTDKNNKDKTSHIYIEDVKNTIKITNSLGLTLEGTPEHPVLIWDKDCKPKFKKLKDITTDDYVCIPRDMNVFPNKSQKIILDKCKYSNSQTDINFPDVMTVDLAKILGYYMGNGCSCHNCIEFCTNNEKIAEDYSNCVTKVFGCKVYKSNNNYTFNSILARDFIEHCFGHALVTARYKEVPFKILNSTKECQKAFLTAYFDCDSSLYKNIFEFSTASLRSVNAIQNMLLNFGIISVRRGKKTKGYDWTYYTLTVGSNDLDILMDKVMDKSLKYDFKRKSYTNTNIDVIPYLKQKIKNTINVSCNGLIKENNKYYLNPYKLSGAKSLTYNKIDELISNASKDIYKDSPSIQSLLSELKEIKDKYYFFSKINKVEYKNEPVTVYDYTIPRSHRFYSNGFISHNTTILENCSPYPCLLTRSGSLRSHFYLKDSHRVVVYRDENNKYYRFTIQLAAHIDSGLVKYYAETSDDEGKTWIQVKDCDGNLDTYKTYVENQFGSLEMYLRTAFFTKGKVKGVNDIASATKGERIALISELTGSDSLSDMHKMIKDKLNDISKEMEKFENIEEQISECKQNIATKKDIESTLSNELTEIEKGLSETEKKISETKKAEEEFNKNFARFGNAIQIKNECENRISELTQHLDKLNAHKKENDFFKVYEKEIMNYKDSYEQSKPLQDNFNKVSKELQLITSEYTECNSAMFEAKNTVDIEQRKFDSIDDRIKSAEENIIGILDTCPTCGAKLTEKKRKELSKANEYVQAEVDSLKEFKVTQKNILSDAKKNLTVAKNKFEKVKEKKNKLQSEFNTLDEQYQATRAYLDMNVKYSSYMNYVPVTNLETDIEKVSKDLDNAKAMLETLSGVEIVDYKSKLGELEESRKSKENNRLQVSMDLASCRTQIEQLDETLVVMNEQSEIMKNLSKDYEEYSILEQAFSTSGIQALELEAAVPSIAEITNQILHDSYGDKFSIAFNTLKQSRNKIIDDFTIEVTNNETGWCTPLELLSEGEKVWVVQALHLAFSLVRMEKTGFGFKIRFADESDGALDSEARLKYVNMLNSVHQHSDSRLTVLVTHSQEIKDIVQQTIQL